MRYAKCFLLISLAIIIHIFIINFLFYPINQLNFVFLVILWLIITGARKTSILRAGLFFGFFVELFSGFPFGVSLASISISAILIGRLLKEIFTSRTIYTVFLSSLLGIIIYRTTLLLSTNIFYIFTKRWMGLNKEVLINLGWEAVLTALLISTAYLTIYRFTDALNPAHVSLKRKDVYE